MNVENLKENAVDIIPDEVIQDPKETEITSTDEKVSELTEEQREIQEKFLRSAFCKRWKYIFDVIYDRMTRHNLTIEDLQKEVDEKKSPFTKMQRQFVKGFKSDFLEQCVTDLYKSQRYL